MPTVYRFYLKNPYAAKRTAKIFFSFSRTTGAAIWADGFVIRTGHSRNWTFLWSEIQSITVCDGHQQREKDQPSHLEKKINKSKTIKVRNPSIGLYNTVGSIKEYFRKYTLCHFLPIISRLDSFYCNTSTVKSLKCVCVWGGGRQFLQSARFNSFKPEGNVILWIT